MADFNDSHKEEMGGNYFEEGIHLVKVMLVEFDETDKGKEYIELTLSDDEGDKEAKVRMWFTTDGAIKYTFNTLRAIFVHNADEGKKDEVRTKFDSLKNTEELDKACQKMLIGKECWLQVSQKGTYLDGQGNPRPNYDRNIYGYEPSPRVNTEEAVAQANKPLEGPNGEQISAF